MNNTLMKTGQNAATTNHSHTTTALAVPGNNGNGDAIVQPPQLPQNNRTLIDVSKLAVDAAVDRLIDHASGMRASDLFFTTNEQHVAVLVRHHGIVHPISILPSELGKRAMSHIKALSGMDVSEKRRPADGRWIFERSTGDSVDLRINVVPTIYG